MNDPQAVDSLRIWHCKYRSLQGLQVFAQVRTLLIATYPDPTLELLTPLVRLRYLSILHLPKVTDLAPLQHLRELEVLSLATLPSWDSSGKTTEVDSLEPLAHLPALRHLELFGVRPRDHSLAPLERCPQLRSARFHKYSASETQRFYAQTRISDAHAPRPPEPGTAP